MLDPKTLRALIKYCPKTGQLIWKFRERSAFKSDKDFKRWNNRYAGTFALNSDNGKGYMHGGIMGKLHKAHRVAWAIHYGEIPAHFIDHVNGNKSDNRIENLRVATNSQNKMNMPHPRNNTSGFKGVSFYKRNGRWRAGIGANGKQKTIGYFDSPEEAYAAYCNAAKELHGEFARVR